MNDSVADCVGGSDWKVLQSSIVPPKPRPAPRRTGSRTLEAINDFFDGSNNHGWGGSNRRNQHQHQVDDDPVAIDEPDPNPRQRGVYAGMTLAAAMRRGIEEDQIRRSSAGRRMTLDSTPAQQSQGGYMVSTSTNSNGTRPGLVGRTLSNSQALDEHRQRRYESAMGTGMGMGMNNGSTSDLLQHQNQHRPNLSVRTNSYDGGRGTGGVGLEPVSQVLNTPEARRSITRSRALATRQGRYRDSGSRDAPVLVESDHSEDD